MKLFVACFLAVAFSSASSSPATPVTLPDAKPDYKTNEVDASKLQTSNIPKVVAPVQTEVTIKEHDVSQIVNYTQICCNKKKGNERYTHPKLPYGYSIISEDCEYITAIKLYEAKKNFHEARKTCSHEGAFLAYATAKEEEDSYIQIMEHTRITEIWTGIHDLFTQFDWSTILGEIASEVAFFRWQSGQPDNAGGNERCTVNSVEGLNDIHCHAEYAYICKIKLPLCS